MQAFDAWTDASPRTCGERGGWRAFRYAPHRGWGDLRLKWRDTRMRPGVPPEGSPPDVQQWLELNRGATLHPGRGESTRNSGPCARYYAPG